MEMRLATRSTKGKYFNISCSRSTSYMKRHCPFLWLIRCIRFQCSRLIQLQFHLEFHSMKALQRQESWMQSVFWRPNESLATSKWRSSCFVPPFAAKCCRLRSKSCWRNQASLPDMIRLRSFECFAKPSLRLSDESWPRWYDRFRPHIYWQSFAWVLDGHTRSKLRYLS